MTSLQFAGNWPPAAAFSAAAILALAAGLLYHREIRRHPSPKAKWLPVLRSLAVLLMALVLTGPVLRQRIFKGTPTRIQCWIDTSQSMGMSDPLLEPSRKITMVEQLGWIRPGSIHLETAAALEKLHESHIALSNIKADSLESTPPTAADDGIQKAEESLSLLRKRGIAASFCDKLERELLFAWKELARKLREPARDPHSIRNSLRQIDETFRRWNPEIETKLREECDDLVARDLTLQRALLRLDQTPRIQRLAALLFGETDESFLRRLASRFEVELWAANDKEGQLLWSSADPKSTLPASAPDPSLGFTDLSQSLGASVARSESPSNGASSTAAESVARAAVLLFTDGQHNEGNLPLPMAALLGDRKIPIFPVGFGQLAPPPDVALTRVEAPNDVFFDDRVHGTLHLNERIPTGQEITLQITHQSRVVWNKQLASTGQSPRTVPFDFAIREVLASRPQSPDGTLAESMVPLQFNASVVPLPGEFETRNNAVTFHLRATQRRRKMLLLDGRPRWEIRYLRNLFERDPQWEVTCLLGGVQPEIHWPRGEEKGSFPSSERALHTYDLIIFGEVPPNTLREEELRWIHSFVAERGGGLLLLDGRGLVLSYLQGPLAPLFPVRPAGGPSLNAPVEKILPAPSAERLPAFRLSSAGSGLDPVWPTLPPPHSLVPCVALPGTDTLLEAHSGKSRAPALVSRRFGSGRVIYSAFDESWRWRLEVGGLYQERFWNQLIPWLAEPPFTVQDGAIALDAGRYLYSPGEPVELRARIRDAKGLPISAKTIRGTLTRDGSSQGSIVLEADENLPGVFRSTSQPKEVGRYEFAIDSKDFGGESHRVSVAWEVQARQTSELAELTLQEELLRKLADASKGEFFREDELPRLFEKLKPWMEGQVIEKEIVLWQSYPWLAAIVALLCAEWILRKRIGLV